MSNELIVHAGTGEIMNPVPMIDREAVLRALRLDAKDPNTQALILTCERYGLDPILKHAVLIQGSLYVTRDGLMHVAHASGRFDGVEVEVTGETSTHFIAAATVWRKDMSRPFKFQGRYPKNGRMGGQYGPEMAEKVAICRALRHAFDVSLCSREELWDNEPEAPGAYGSQPGAPSRPAPAQIASAPNPPAPAKPPMDPELRAAIQEFVTVWNQELVPSGGIVLDKASPITNKMERESAIALWFENDHMLEHAPDAGHYRQAAQEIRERLTQAAETAEESEPPAEEVAVKPVEEDALDLSDIEDPFATPEPVAAGGNYSDHETKLRPNRGRK